MSPRAPPFSLATFSPTLLSTHSAHARAHSCPARPCSPLLNSHLRVCQHGLLLLRVPPLAAPARASSLPARTPPPAWQSARTLVRVFAVERTGGEFDPQAAAELSKQARPRAMLMAVVCAMLMAVVCEMLMGVRAHACVRAPA
eukprot:4921048-Pleurochrysis_carterae.AAC.1